MGEYLPTVIAAAGPGAHRTYGTAGQRGRRVQMQNAAFGTPVGAVAIPVLVVPTALVLLTALTVRLDVPVFRPPRGLDPTGDERATALVARRELQAWRDGDVLVIDLPVIDLFEVVRIHGTR